MIRNSFEGIFNNIHLIISEKKTLGKEKVKVSPRIVCLLQDICDMKTVSTLFNLFRISDHSSQTLCFTTVKVIFIALSGCCILSFRIRIIKYNFQRGWKKRGTSGPGLMKKDELAKFTERMQDKEKRSTEENYRDNIERRSREK